MTVRCPQCSTRYRLPPRSRLGRNPTYRCTRCRHVFAPDEEAEAPLLDEPEDDPVLDPDADDDSPVFTVEPAARDREADEELEPAQRRARSEVPSPATPARFAARAALTVAIVYGILSIYFYTHPARARALLGTIPLVGEQMSETQLHPGNIQLADVHGEWKRVHGDRLVFVVSGTAINNAPVPVAGIQIEGHLGDGPRQIVYCGAAPQDVGELGIREIELLQTLKPSGDWILPPGEQDRFLVAFIDPPLPVTEFTVEVVAVRGAARRADAALAKTAP